MLPLAGCTAPPPEAPPTARVPVAGELADFELFDPEGHAYQLYRLSDYKTVTVVGFESGCGLFKKNTEGLRKLARRVSEEGGVALGLDSNPGDSREVIRRALRRLGLNFPVLRDPSQVVARELGFRQAGDSVEIDTRGWKVARRGKIGDANPPHAPSADAGLAADLKMPGAAERSPAVCEIPFLHDEHPLTYTGDIARILQRKCLNCHSKEGEFKPYFSDFATVKGWTAMIRETILTQRMPIWGVDSDPGEFSNDNSLTSEQKRKVVAWIDAGALRGEGADPLVGFKPELSGLSPIDPTFVAEMDREVEVPPEGFNEYNYYQLGGPLPRDMWVDYVEGISSNPRAMHHATLMVTPLPLSAYAAQADLIRKESPPPEAGSNEALDPGMPNYFPMNKAIYTNLRARKTEKPRPGSPYSPDELIRFAVYSTYGRNNARHTYPNTARFLPKGYYLILESHHHGTGKPEKERTKILFHEVAKTPALRVIRRLDQTNRSFTVPPHAKNFRVNLDTFVAGHDMYILNCLGHMHMRGRELQSWIVRPDGGHERLLTISSFLYDWHSGAQLSFLLPKVVPKGSRIESYAVIDNSASNPFNPDPGQTVRFGQTLHKDEMPRLQCGFYYPN